ncbi:MAG: Mu transposase C-terminal domain-containing protein [Syntrophomonadaceae bacterium]
MNRNLAVNELIEWQSESDHFTERIVWIDEGYVLAYVIDIFSENGFPYKRTIPQIAEAIESGLATVLEKDPWGKMVLEEDIPENAKAIRDKAWKVIETLAIQENEPQIYKREVRGPLVQEIAKEFGTTDKTVYRYLRRYWQRGKNMNALLPDYDKSGGKGKDKAAGEKKRGRPRKHSLMLGNGVNVDEDTKRIFRVAIKRYYYTRKGIPLTDVYKLMIKDYFAEKECAEHGYVFNLDKNIPTFAQFKYWFSKECDIKEKTIARKGLKAYELEHRPILGSSDTDITGPGAMFQIDATVADVFLVSRFNRNWIIGRPVVYVIIDVFSRMITGLYVGLEGPSWLGAMMALANAATDKVKFCAEYGIEIAKEDWPCHHIPEAITADRGEMLSKNVEPMIKALKVRIQYASPFRADWKGIVEQHFRILHKRVKPFVPGYVDKDFRQRGARDYRLDAKLDIYQFTKIIINCVLFHNNEHYLSSYVRQLGMIEDDVARVPIDLWKWGIVNRSGRLRRESEDIVKLNLMPRYKTTITGQGIKFKNMFYSCESAEKQSWFVKARKKNWSITVSYDPRNLNYLYIPDEDGHGFEKCFLLPKSEERYTDKSLDEIQYLLDYEKLEEESSSDRVMLGELSLFDNIQTIVTEGETMTAATKSEQSNNAKLKGIGNNRKWEQEELRKLQAYELDPKDTTDIQTEAEVKIENQDSNPLLELLTKKQEERDYESRQ